MPKSVFDLTLMAPQMITNANGDRVLTQWFERARFEYHPTNPQAANVLLGLMGVERFPDGKFSPPAPCQAFATGLPTPVNVSGTPSFCVGWRDAYADEQRFLIILRYPNSGEEFRYIASPNTTTLYVSASDRPGAPSSAQCAQRNAFSIEVQAIRPNATAVVGSMAREGECRR